MKMLILGAALAALASGTAANAQRLQVSYPTDAQMDCAAVAAESARMDQLVADAQPEGQIQTATTRKAVMVGLWSGKGCDASPAAPAAVAAPAETEAEAPAAATPSGF